MADDSLKWQSQAPTPRQLAVESDPPETLDFIIVVHGMGEQRKGRTVAEVIQSYHYLSRLEEILEQPACGDGRIDSHHAPEPLSVSPAHLDAMQSRFGFVPGADVPGCEESLKDFAFAEVYWADITSKQFETYGASLAEWSASLLQQLENRRDSPLIKERRSWLFSVLRVMRGGLVNLNMLLRPRLGWISDLAFNRYLGDVQMYAEDPRSRARAMWRFQDAMQKLHARASDKYPNTNCRYHIVAHSLGTVLALDALIMAHAKLEILSDALLLNSEGEEALRDTVRKRLAAVQRNQTAAPDESTVEEAVQAAAWFAHTFDLSYSTRFRDSQQIDFTWRDKVKTFVTLGSPIDKFLVLWERNFRQLRNSDQPTVDDVAAHWTERNEDAKIRHLNYADEQDPVGNHLNVMHPDPSGSSARHPIVPVIDRIFGSQAAEDVVFNRYPIPAAAHTRYLTDPGLTDRIRHFLINPDHAQPVKAHPDFCFTRSRYVWTLGWNYFWIQTAITLVLIVCLAGLATAADWKTKLLLGIPSAWFFWMVLPEFLWLLAVWRTLVDRLRDATADAPYAWKRWRLRKFASVSSIAVDVLFILSFLVVVCAGFLKYSRDMDAQAVKTTIASTAFERPLASVHAAEISRHGRIDLLCVTAVLAIFLVIWKLLALRKQAQGPSGKPGLWPRFLKLARHGILVLLMFGLMTIIGFWDRLPENCYQYLHDSDVHRIAASAGDALRSGVFRLPFTQAWAEWLSKNLRTDRSWAVAVIATATVAVAGTFDLVVRRLAVIEVGQRE